MKVKNIVDNINVKDGKWEEWLIRKNLLEISLNQK
jgi:hypothetical protein